MKKKANPETTPVTSKNVVAKSASKTGANANGSKKTSIVRKAPKALVVKNKVRTAFGLKKVQSKEKRPLE